MSSIKLAWQTERLAGLSDHGSNLPCLTTWVGRVLLSPVPYGDLLSLSFKKSCHTLSLSLLLLLFRWCFSILISWCRGWGIYTWVNIYLIYISIKLLARCSYQGDVAGAIYHTWRRIGKFDYPYFFCHTAAATNTLLVVEKARVSGEDHKSLATLSCAWEVGNPGSCERQQAVSVQPYYEAT